MSRALAITPEAATLIRTLVDDDTRSDETGLRIVVDAVHHSLSMGLAVRPAASDAVVTRDGARVFLSPSAARRLGGRTLRAEISPDRSLFFLDN